MNNYYHNSGLGDLIYSIPTIRELGEGNLYLSINREPYNAVYSLMKNQSCIENVYHTDDVDCPKGFIDLSKFRHHPYFNDRHIVNIHREVFKLQSYEFNKVYLDIPNVIPEIEKEYSIINVTPRYRDKFFNWKSEVKFLKENSNGVYFLGFKKDHTHFCIKYGYIPYIETKTLLDAAIIIKNAKYFSGNESSLLAIRQGLNLPYRFEKHPFVTHVITNDKSKETILNNKTWRLHRNLSLLKKYTIGYNEKF